MARLRNHTEFPPAWGFSIGPVCRGETLPPTNCRGDDRSQSLRRVRIKRKLLFHRQPPSHARREGPLTTYWLTILSHLAPR